jgi:hypothetical protein
MNTPSVISATQLNLSWSAATDAQSGIGGYKIRWCTGTSCTPTTAFTVGNQTTYSHTGRTPSTLHRYTVAAINGDGLEGSESNTVQATTSAAGNPSVTRDSASYAPGATITATANEGLSGVQEWIKVSAVADADSVGAVENQWKYLQNCSQSVPSVAPTYPKSCTFAVTGTGSYNIRYFRENGTANKLAQSANFSVGLSPEVTTNQSSYTLGQTITATMANGAGGLQEWIRVFINTQADSETRAPITPCQQVVTQPTQRALPSPAH